MRRASQRQDRTRQRARRLQSVVRPLAPDLESFASQVSVPPVRARQPRLPPSARHATGRPLLDRAPPTCHGASVPAASRCRLPTREDPGRARSNRTACFGPRHLARHHGIAGLRARGFECDRWQSGPDRSSYPRLRPRPARDVQPSDNAESGELRTAVRIASRRRSTARGRGRYLVRFRIPRGTAAEIPESLGRSGRPCDCQLHEATWLHQ